MLVLGAFAAFIVVRVATRARRKNYRFIVLLFIGHKDTHYFLNKEIKEEKDANKTLFTCDREVDYKENDCFKGKSAMIII